MRAPISMNEIALKNSYNLSGLEKFLNPDYKFKLIGKSLNPSDRQIRAWEVEETLRRTRKTTGELFPNAGDLHAHLTRPVNKISYYQTARCRVQYTVK